MLNASEKFEGSAERPKIFKDIEQNIDNADSIPYRDLQGYREEIGSILKKGGLKSDIYQAYNALQDGIDGEIAEDCRPQRCRATTARRTRIVAQPETNVLRPQISAQEVSRCQRTKRSSGGLAGQDRTGIESLSRYNPELARSANTIRGYDAEARSTTVPKPSTKPAPELAPRKAPINYPAARVADARKISAEDVQAAKADSLSGKINSAQRRANWIAASPLFYGVHEAIKGNIGGLAESAAAGAAISMGARAIGNFLHKPEVMQFMTKATEKDLAAIPPELRGDFPRAR